MPVLHGHCSFSEADDFVHVFISAGFAGGPWHTQEAALQELIDGLSRLRTRAFVLDLSKVASSGSAVITAVVRIWKSVAAGGGRLAVFAPGDQIQSALSVSGLSSRMTVARSAEEALDLLGISSAARIRRREALMLKWSAPVAAAIAIIAMMLTRFSLSPIELERSFALVATICAAIAGGGGGLSAVRDLGALISFQGFVSATGILTLMTAIGSWTL